MNETKPYFTQEELQWLADRDTLVNLWVRTPQYLSTIDNVLGVIEDKISDERKLLLSGAVFLKEEAVQYRQGRLGALQELHDKLSAFLREISLEAYGERGYDGTKEAAIAQAFKDEADKGE